MVTHIYTSKTVNARGTRVTVRQVLGRGDSQVRRRIVSIASAAKGWLAQTLPECNSNPTAGVTAAYTLCFRQPPDSAGMNTVKSVLSQVNSRLSSPYGVKVLSTDAYGYNRRYYGGRIHTVDGVIQYDTADRTISHRGEIHVNRDTVLNDAVMATVTLIHEATHKFSNLRDFGNQGYFRNDYSDYTQPGLIWNNALRNADSYAVFVYKVVLSKFHHVIVA